MNSPLKQTIRTADENDIRAINQNLGLFNQSKLNFVGESEKRLEYVIYADNHMIAGISACIDWGFIVHIELLFVNEHHRHKGLGKLLIDKVEKEAKALGAGMAQTDTFDFQAKDFYLKLGYVVFGELESSPSPGHKRYYFKKNL